MRFRPGCIGTAAAALCATGVGSAAGNSDWDAVEKVVNTALPLVTAIEGTSDAPQPLGEDAATTPMSSGRAALLLSPPPAMLASRLRSLMNKQLADSDDETTPVRK